MLLDAGRGTPVETGWVMTPEGSFSVGSTPDEIVVAEAGTFYYGATDPVSGCRDSVAVEVLTDTDLPSIDVSVDGQIDCDNDEVTLAGSGPGAGFSVSWTATDGGELDPSTTDQYFRCR